jgi:hypothetical protein
MQKYSELNKSDASFLQEILVATQFKFDVEDVFKSTCK